MTGKQFREIDDIINGQFERDDTFDDEDLAKIEDEEFQIRRTEYLLAKRLLCEFLGYE